jgi:aminopeptidase C
MHLLEEEIICMISGLQAHDYSLVFGVDVQLGMDKSDRLIYGDSLMTHAMVGAISLSCAHYIS